MEYIRVFDNVIPKDLCEDLETLKKTRECS